MRVFVTIIIGLFLNLELAVADFGGVPVQKISVAALQSPPVLDGNLADWENLDFAWSLVPVAPALPNDANNHTGSLQVKMKVGVFADQIYFAFSWPDDSPDESYRSWMWRRGQYRRGRNRDDMFAIRFALSGDYDACMLPDSPKTYLVDLWIWSAGRSNLVALADDRSILVSSDYVESAAEHFSSGAGKIYIKEYYDAGKRAYALTRPRLKKFQGKLLSGVAITGAGSGGVVDVAAKGSWQDGNWYLEMSRKLNTENADDVVFPSFGSVLGAIAVFNKGWEEHKSVSGDLLFEFSQTKP